MPGDRPTALLTPNGCLSTCPVTGVEPWLSLLTGNSLSAGMIRFTILGSPNRHRMHRTNARLARGTTSFVIWESDGNPTLLLEMVFVVECLAPAKLRRPVLPPTPVKWSSTIRVNPRLAKMAGSSPFLTQCSLGQPTLSQKSPKSEILSARCPRQRKNWRTDKLKK